MQDITTEQEKILALCKHLNIDVFYHDCDIWKGNEKELIAKYKTKLIDNPELDYDDYLDENTCIFDDIEVSKHDDCCFEYGSWEFLVCDDGEADKLEKIRVEDLIEDCYLSEYKTEEKKSGRKNPLLQYLDLNKWIEDWCGNRGNNLSSYDSEEHYEDINETTYYIYRTN